MVGAEGGLVSSHDKRLTLVFQPGALIDDTEIVIFPSDVPPEIYGAAYRVQPDIELRVAAEVTYRRPLPPIEPRAVAVAAVRTSDFTTGMGFWQPLPRLFIDLSNESVTAKDDELSLYYGMFDYNGIETGDDGGGGACATSASDCFIGSVFNAGAGPRDVCFGDFDANGTVDVMTADGRADSVSVLLSSGVGALGAPTAITVGAGPSSVKCGLIAGDAASDFVVALEGGSTVIFGRNNGDATFTLADPVAVASGPVDVALVDMNSDGFPDAPTVGSGGAASALTLMLPDGFVSGGDQLTSPYVPSPTGLAVGNINGSIDQFPDVAVFGGNGLVVGLGQGNGSFGPFDEMTSATVGAALARGVAGDVSGDGIDDLIIADAGMGGVHVLQSVGDGMSFTPLFSQTGAGASDAVLGDFDGDGVAADIAVANAVDGTVSVLVRVGPAYTNAGTLIAGAGPSGLAAADISGDGIDDIVVSNESADTVTLFISSQP